MTRILVYLLTSISLFGCSAYKNKFACEPALGATCQSVEEIHAMLQNGKIWELNNSQPKCRGKACAKLLEEDRIANNDRIIKVWIPEHYRIEEHREGQYWYLSANAVR